MSLSLRLAALRWLSGVREGRSGQGGGQARPRLAHSLLLPLLGRGGRDRGSWAGEAAVPLEMTLEGRGETAVEQEHLFFLLLILFLGLGEERVGLVVGLVL